MEPTDYSEVKIHSRPQQPYAVIELERKLTELIVAYEESVGDHIASIQVFKIPGMAGWTRKTSRIEIVLD